jgi:hypothetical protein
MASAQVKGGDDPLHLRRAAVRDCEPWPLAAARIDVSCRFVHADVRQPSASRLEPPACVNGRTRPVFPARNAPLLQLSGILGSAAGLNAGSGRSRVAAGPRHVALRQVTVIRLVRATPEFAHTTSITIRPILILYSERAGCFPQVS